jgi:hypothetical protein
MMMWIKRSGRVTISACCYLSLIWSPALQAQPIQTQVATVPAATAVPAVNLAARNKPMAMARALYNRKHQMLEHHHRPIPLQKLAARALAAAPATAGPETTITSLLTTPAATKVSLLSEHVFTAAETNSGTSLVCEPSVGTRGAQVLYTGNWFAAFSSNGGGTFTFVDPNTTFPSTHGGFCCDQVAVYDSKNDVLFWNLQYINDSSGNVQRLALAHGNDIATENWHYYDFSPQSVGNWQKEWFDFPDLVVGANYLYLSSNAFSTEGQEPFTRCVMLRLPLDKLAKYEGFSYNYFSATDVGGPRATQGATDPMYWATHVNQQTVRVFTWKEADTTISQNDVTVQSWSDSTRVAPGPDGRDWLGREDGRMTGAFQSGNNIGFAWTAAQDGTFPFPQVRVVIMDGASKAVSSQPHIWNKEFAFAYPALAPNQNGTVGISLSYGGKLLYPSHAVGILTNSNTWDLVSTASGTSGPAENVWGDYLTIRPDPGNPKAWVATGYTLQGGAQQTNSQPLYVDFTASP